MFTYQVLIIYNKNIFASLRWTHYVRLKSIIQGQKYFVNSKVAIFENIFHQHQQYHKFLDNTRPFWYNHISQLNFG